MSTEGNKLLSRRFFEEVLKNGNLAVGDELCAASEEALERKVFGLALALVAKEVHVHAVSIRSQCLPDLLRAGTGRLSVG